MRWKHKMHKAFSFTTLNKRKYQEISSFKHWGYYEDPQAAQER